jgi:pimeloyl-ACP methyl ester carboxylesterase
MNSGQLDAEAEASTIAFDRVGAGDKILMISGFPQTRLSWNRLIPLISHKFEALPADLPSIGDSGILRAPTTTENVARVFHAFAAGQGAPLHVVAHGRMDAAFDYCRKIVEDMEFNKTHFTGKLTVPLHAVGGEHAIPNMGEALKPYFENVTSVTIPDSGHFVPEEQPEALARALLSFL